MPIFEYQCDDCGRVSEFLTGTGRSDETVCPECGSSRMHKLMSTSAVLSGHTRRTDGRTCCGRAERCEQPPCHNGGGCRHG